MRYCHVRLLSFVSTARIHTNTKMYVAPSREALINAAHEIPFTHTQYSQQPSQEHIDKITATAFEHQPSANTSQQASHFVARKELCQRALNLYMQICDTQALRFPSQTGRTEPSDPPKRNASVAVSETKRFGPVRIV